MTRPRLRLECLDEHHSLDNFESGNERLDGWLHRHAEALRKAVAASEAVAARLVVVDAVDDGAVRFYERFGFVAASENPPLVPAHEGHPREPRSRVDRVAGQ